MKSVRDCALPRVERKRWRLYIPFRQLQTLAEVEVLVLVEEKSKSSEAYSRQLQGTVRVTAGKAGLQATAADGPHADGVAWGGTT